MSQTERGQRSPRPRVDAERNGGIPRGWNDTLMTTTLDDLKANILLAATIAVTSATITAAAGGCHVTTDSPATETAADEMMDDTSTTIGSSSSAGSADGADHLDIADTDGAATSTGGDDDDASTGTPPRPDTITYKARRREP